MGPEERARRVFIGSELPIYYPGERRFAPDLMVVLDVEPHVRGKWVVSYEGKGLDWVMEVHVGGDRKKDAEDNVERYARLGVGGQDAAARVLGAAGAGATARG